MEKIVLSKGYEFDIVPNGIQTKSNELTFTVIPGEYTIEQLLEIWDGNLTIVVKNGDAEIRQFKSYTDCFQILVQPNYLLETKYVCPECKAEVEPIATTCESCNATFEAPGVVETRVKVCKISVKIPDINTRVTNCEEAVEDIINTILG